MSVLKLGSTGSKRSFSSENGSLQVFLVVSFMLLILVGIGSWSVMRTWRFNVTTQLRLNRCTAKKTLELRNLMNFLESSNEQIKYLRVLIKAATLKPALIPGFKAALESMVALQEAKILYWRISAVHWVAMPCQNSGDHGWPLPSLSLIRPMRDTVGSHPWSWKEGTPPEMCVGVKHRPRASVGCIEKENNDENKASRSYWKAKWASPGKFWNYFL